MALPSTPARKPPPCPPHRQAEHRCVDGDRKRPEQPRHKRRHYRDSAKPDARHPGRTVKPQPPQPPAAERQRQAARRDENQRSRRHQQSDRPLAGPGRCRRIRHESHRRARHHSGRQPQERQRTIGIGGSLAAPPLPHHRAYGSVHGGSTDLSDRAVFDRSKAEPGEEGVRHRVGERGTVADPPWAMGAAGSTRRQALSDPEAA